MGLSSALQIGRSGLIASQTAIEVAGNNLANIGTKGYHRQDVALSPIRSEELGEGVFVGRGVQIEAIIRRVDEALESRLRSGISQQSSSALRLSVLEQLEGVENELTGVDLSSQLNEFFNALGELSNRPADRSLRVLVLEQANTLTEHIHDLREGITGLRLQLNGQIQNAAIAVDDLLTRIGLLNEQISNAEGGQGGASDLRDKRGQLLTEVAQYLDVSVVEQKSGVVDVYVGSTPLILNGRSRGLRLNVEGAGETAQHELITVEDGTRIMPTGGELGTLIEINESELLDAQQSLDDFAAQLILQVNRVHTRGQGAAGFASLTSHAAVADASAALNGAAAELPFTPRHGSFQIHVTQKSTGLRSIATIQVDLDGIDPDNDTTLNSLAAAIDAIDNISASVTTARKLRIDAGAADFEFSFSDDSSDVLAALGLNTLFTGSDSLNIDINSVVEGNPAHLAVAQGHVPGDNRNALELLGLRSKSLEDLDNLSLTDAWTRHVESVAIKVSQARQRFDADSAVRSSLEAQQQRISGVNVDEETINLLGYQRLYQASARFLSVVNELMDTIITLT